MSRRISLPDLKLFWKWVDERQRIWHRRFVLKEPPPWTKDPLLRDFHWCNVYRQLDRESQYVLTTLDAIYDGEARLFATLVFRLFNRRATWERYSVYPKATMDLRKFKTYLTMLRKEGTNPFTNAYIVNSGGAAFSSRVWLHQGSIRDAAYLEAIKWIRKHLNSLNEDRKDLDPAAMHRRLQDIPCVGGFVAYQLWLDLTYTNLVMYTDDDFAFPGPGTRRGLKAIFPKEKPTVALIRELENMQAERLPEDFPFWKSGASNQWISLANISNCLCEFAKYRKMQRGTGKVQRYFHPAGTPLAYDLVS